jgi:hypothetical protein
MEEKDQRWEVSIPCSIEWGDRTTTGTVVNISLESALITIENVVPPEGTVLILILQVDPEEVRFKGKMGPKVVHAGWEPKNQVGIGLLGVQFQEPRQDIMKKLSLLIPSLSENDD